MSFLSLEWWEYFIIILLVFMAFLFVNYVLKKYNEARIEDRLSRLLLKACSSQGTQIQELSLEIESKKLNNEPSDDKNDKCKPQLAGISLVFNKDDNVIQEVRRKIDTSDVSQEARNWDVKNITKMTQNNDESVFQERKSIKPNKLVQNDNIKPILPRSIVIKDSKDACDNTLSSMKTNAQKPDETVYMKIKHTLFKSNKFEPKAVAKSTYVGSILSDDSKRACSNNYNDPDLQVSPKTEESQEKICNSLKLINLKPEALTPKFRNFSTDSNIVYQNSIDIRSQDQETLQKSKDTLSHESAFLKTERLELKTPIVKESNSDNNLVKDSKISSTHFNKSRLLTCDMLQKAQGTLSPQNKNNKSQPEPLPIKVSNIDNIAFIESKITCSTDADLMIPKTLLKIEEKTDNLDLRMPAANETDRNNSLVRDSKTTYRYQNHVNKAENLILDTPKKNDTLLKTNKSQPKTLPIEVSNMECIPVANAKMACNNSIEFEVLIPETTHKTEELLSSKNTDSTLNTNNLEQNSIEANSSINVMNQNNSIDDSTSSSITIGLLMTETSLNTNKMYERTDPLLKKSLESNDKPLASIPVINTELADDASTNSKCEPSEIDILLKDKELAVKANKIMKKSLITFSTSTVSAPQTSILREKEKNLTHNLSDTSTNKYNRRMKKFWELFTTNYQT